MANRFKNGDRVSWNSEAGRVSGTIIWVHTQNVDDKGHTHHASPEFPQYEIKSSKTDHIAMHKGAALTILTKPPKWPVGQNVGGGWLSTPQNPRWLTCENASNHDPIPKV